ncbi:cyclase family protein [Cohnella zeiphila]|uniref:Cyclase family protein n=1 Tax=Cohnella zeiphila TaxID=2761120 RepID=A0A7X0VYP9_9BACL|nr:cyclase family protein [Cohnella zeiphila]MBB6735231.1 cyclase family protein [Cohnella zeiphila]
MRIVDLSMPIYDGMPVYPGDPEVTVEIAHTRDRYGWELRKLAMGTHAGTHVDAPSHMHEGAATLDELPLDAFFGLSQVVCANDSWPRARGLFFAETAGEALFGRLKELAPPFVGGELTEELERLLLGAGIVTYTSLNGLDRLPRGVDFLFCGFPLRIREGDGSPVRAVAVFADDIGGFGKGEER